LYQKNLPLSADLVRNNRSYGVKNTHIIQEVLFMLSVCKIYRWEYLFDHAGCDTFWTTSHLNADMPTDISLICDNSVTT